MSIIVVFLGALLLFLSLLFLLLLNKIYKIKLEPVQFKTIDGLRGYLAFFVFLHHSYFYYYFNKNNVDSAYLLNIINQFGDTSVVLFFMITGFLFTCKLLDEKELKIDWLKFYIFRIFRIYAVFILLVCLQLAVIFWVSDFTFIHNPLLVAKEIIIWLTFSITDYLPINGFIDTQLMTAKVLWTIKYEVFFYLCIPIMAVFISKIKPSLLATCFFLICSLYIGYKINTQTIYIFPFIIGIITAIFSKNQQIYILAQKQMSSFIILGCLISVMVLYSTSYNYFAIFILSFSFIGIACGNSIFGILSLNLSRLFGQLSYSMYLLHGIVLYLIFNLCVGKTLTKQLSNFEYVTTIFGCSALLIFISISVFKFIEKPSMSATINSTRKIRNVLKKTTNNIP